MEERRLVGTARSIDFASVADLGASQSYGAHQLFAGNVAASFAGSPSRSYSAGDLTGPAKQ